MTSCEREADLSDLQSKIEYMEARLAELGGDALPSAVPQNLPQSNSKTVEKLIEAYEADKIAR